VTSRWADDPVIFLTLLALSCGAAIAINAVILARLSPTPPARPGPSELTS
jgi:hypothetical protein